MKKLAAVILLLALACGTARPTQVSQPAELPRPAATAPALLGSVDSLTGFYEREHSFTCETNQDHWRCFSPNKAIKVVFFGDPVNEATISIPLSEGDNKPAKYIRDLVLQTGLDVAAWEWLTPNLNEAEISKDFGNKRLTSVFDDEGWLVTVQAR